MSGARRMIETARGYLGYREGPGNSNRFSAEMGRAAESWCADFVSAVARESGNTGVFPDTASCPAARAWFQRRGRLSVYPAIGAQVLFGAPGNPYGPGAEHTGICIAYDEDTITVIAGNTNDDGSANGDGVYRRTYLRRSAYVDCYGYPAYPEGLVCADPHWRGRAGITCFGHQASEDDLPSVSTVLAVGITRTPVPEQAPVPERDRNGQERGGRERGGRERSGRERSGRERSGRERSGRRTFSDGEATASGSG
ncbi:hypothetical protein ACFC1R_04265 [Kitasatospora sp. NPDC056138]|uniref:hypothetical protein n=1 Tax=Kitasatospora sp. NPDC056138 TaxID=3345724 RepID=UPI0035DB7293